MKLFIDTANIEEIKKANEFVLLDGVTTNPSLVAKEKREFKELILEICNIVHGPISAEVISTEADKMVEEAKKLSELHPNIVIKIPIIKDGLKAVKILSEEGVKTNVTLVFSALQALLAAKAGATYVSPFVGRLDDVGHNGMELVEQILTIFNNYGFKTEVIVGSVRHPLHILKAALLGAHIVTAPFKVIEQMVKHPLTDVGLERSLADWKKLQG